MVVINSCHIDISRIKNNEKNLIWLSASMWWVVQLVFESRSILYWCDDQSFKCFVPEIHPVEFIAEFVQIRLEKIQLYPVIHILEQRFGIGNGHVNPGKNLRGIFSGNGLPFRTGDHFFHANMDYLSLTNSLVLRMIASDIWKSKGKRKALYVPNAEAPGIFGRNS